MKVVQRVNPKSSHHKEKTFLYFFNFCIHEMMDVPLTYCGHHFMMCISQIIMLYTLNLYSAVCQLYLNKIGRKKFEKNTTQKGLRKKMCIFLFLSDKNKRSYHV